MLLGVAAAALAAQGDENLPCPDGGHFILQDNTQENIDILVGRGLVEGETTGGVTHTCSSSGPIDQAVFDTIMEGFEQEQGEQPSRWCCRTASRESTPTATPRPARPRRRPPRLRRLPRRPPTPEGSVAVGTSTPTPEGSVQGGTGTPEPSQPDTAMGVQRRAQPDPDHCLRPDPAGGPRHAPGRTSRARGAAPKDRDPNRSPMRKTPGSPGGLSFARNGVRCSLIRTEVLGTKVLLAYPPALLTGAEVHHR